MTLLRTICRLRQFNSIALTIRTSATTSIYPIVGRTRLYATQTKAPRDRSINASTIKFIDLNGDFQGPQSLSRILSSYDPAQYTLLNLTPNQDVPTCRLYTRDAVRDMETKAYTKKREKSKVGSDPSKVLKECTLNWNVTQHDLLHKLDSGLSALRKGNKLTLQIGTKFKRGSKPTSIDVREELLKKVVGMCAEVGREWRAREGDLQKGIVLHYLGSPPAAPKQPEPSQTTSDTT